MNQLSPPNEDNHLNHTHDANYVKGSSSQNEAHSEVEGQVLNTAPGNIIINAAIIAHVDHGKTTLVDAIFKQTSSFRDNQSIEERIMDSNAQEKERGITILAKCTSVMWKGVKVNIIDTPGHADFGGEVERVLSMADMVILLVDAAEGVMPQTKFVLAKALKAALRVIVIINKVDRPDARIEEVISEIDGLFIDLEASDEQLEFPVLYASGRQGWCTRKLGDKHDEVAPLSPLLDCILNYYIPTSYDQDGDFKMLATLSESDKFLGKILIGKIYQGNAKVNMPVKVMNIDGEIVEQAKIIKLFTFLQLNKLSVETAIAGDIIAVAGVKAGRVSDTICSLSATEPVPSTKIDPPTMSVVVGVNDSTFAGQEGSKLTSTLIGDRLFAEAETNVAIKVRRNENESFEVSGRGELQLGVLIENMRREGFEISVSRPKVLFSQGPNGEKLEPIEEVTIDVDDQYSGIVSEKIGLRRGSLRNMQPFGAGRTRMIFDVPSRCLIGYYSEFLTDTRGTGVLNKSFLEFGAYRGSVSERNFGVLVSNDTGNATAYSLNNLQSRGILYIGHGDKVYAGMIVGQNSRDNDLEVNVIKGKQLTNIRAAGSDENIKLSPPKLMSLEEMLTFINDDELVEVTPKALRLRKRYLDPNLRKRMARGGRTD